MVLYRMETAGTWEIQIVFLISIQSNKIKLSGISPNKFKKDEDGEITI